MADNPKKQAHDRSLISLQEHEIAYLMKKAGISRQAAINAIKTAGPRRDQVMAYLEANKA